MVWCLLFRVRWDGAWPFVSKRDAYTLYVVLHCPMLYCIVLYCTVEGEGGWFAFLEWCLASGEMGTAKAWREVSPRMGTLNQSRLRLG